jgi:hypothetical protein
MELHPTTALRVFEELGRVDSAVGWLVANAAVITTFFQVFTDAGSARSSPSRTRSLPVAGPARRRCPPTAAIADGQWAFGVVAGMPIG